MHTISLCLSKRFVVFFIYGTYHLLYGQTLPLLFVLCVFVSGIRQKKIIMTNILRDKDKEQQKHARLRRNVNLLLDALAISLPLPPQQRRFWRNPSRRCRCCAPGVVRHRSDNNDDHRRRQLSSSLSSRISVTTLSNGYFELSFHSHNLRDLAAAFLQSALPQ